MPRIVAFRHRRKKTTKGEARPTQVAILPEHGKTLRFDLKTTRDELDFVHGVWPSKMRETTSEDDLLHFKPHHIEWRELEKNENVGDFPAHLIRTEGKKKPKYFFATKVPSEFEGLKAGDHVAMLLGGSGDRLASRCSVRSQTLGGDTQVFRIPTFTFKSARPDDETEVDPTTLAGLYRDRPELYRLMTPRDRTIVRLRTLYKLRTLAMEARIKAEQRAKEAQEGELLCALDDTYPDGDVEQELARIIASDPVIMALETEEKKREKALASLVTSLDVWTELLEGIQGIGIIIAARFLDSVKDIRLFDSPWKLIAYCGAYPDAKGLVRNRTDDKSTSKYNRKARQACFIFGDQLVRQADSYWGLKFREIKVAYQAKHPEHVVQENGKKKYFKGHLHKMAIWKTLGKFLKWLWNAWWNLETRHGAVKPPKSSWRNPGGKKKPADSAPTDHTALPPDWATV